MASSTGKLIIPIHNFVRYNKSFSLYFWLNYFLSNFKLFSSLLRKGWWITSSNIGNKNIIRMYLATYYLAMQKHILWWDTFFNNSINFIFILRISQFLFLNNYSLILLQTFSTYQLDFSVFWLLNSWIFCVAFHSFSEFLIFVTFRMLWMLVAVNKLKRMALHGHTPRKVFCVSN